MESELSVVPGGAPLPVTDAQPRTPKRTAPSGFARSVAKSSVSRSKVQPMETARAVLSKAPGSARFKNLAKAMTRDKELQTRCISQLLDEREQRLAAQQRERRESLPEVAAPIATRWVLRSDSNLRLGWDFMLMWLLLYLGIATPYRIGFDDPPSGNMWFFEIIIDFLFIVDLMLNFRTGFERDTGEEEMRPAEIRMHYLRGWFGIDLVSSIPVELMFQSGGEARSLKLVKTSKILRALRLIKLAKLLRVMKKPRLMEVIEEHFSLSQQQTKSFKMLVMMFSLSHFVACGWGYMGTQVHATTLTGCLDVTKGAARCYANWLKRYEQMLGRTIGFSEQYLVSLYWSFTTISTVGYGDITPHTEGERAFTIAAMVTGVGFYGYFISSMAAIMHNLDANEAKYLEKMSAITSYMKLRNFPKKLRVRIKKYYKNFFQRKTCLDETVILGELSTFLRREVAMFLLSDIIYTIPFFQGRDPNVLAKILTILKPITVAPGDSIMHKGEPGEEMFIVISGQLEVLEADGVTTLKTLGKGRYFGEFQFFGLFPVRTATVRAVTACELHSLGKEDLLAAFRNHPEEVEDMKAMAELHYERVHGEVDHIPARLEGMERVSSQQFRFGAKGVALQHAQSFRLESLKMEQRNSRADQGAAPRTSSMPTSHVLSGWSQQGVQCGKGNTNAASAATATAAAIASARAEATTAAPPGGDESMRTFVRDVIERKIEAEMRLLREQIAAAAARTRRHDSSEE